MSRGRLDLEHLLDDAIEELASLHELHDFIVVVGVVLDELVYLITFGCFSFRKIRTWPR